MSILQDDQVINNTYTVERFLGEGAFAEVYRVRHRFLGRQAMKVFKLAGLTMNEVEEQLSEAVILSQINHPNIIRVFDANIFEDEGRMYGFFVMEYISGGSLHQFWNSFGAKLVPMDTTVDIMRQICRGVAVAHSTEPPIIHRDLKPQNILVGYDGAGVRVRVSDFGLAKRANPLTLLVSSRGTLIFKAPETFKDTQGDSCTGDVWALGCILYMLLTDQLPYTELTENKDAPRFDLPLRLPSDFNISVDDALECIAVKALALNPAERYPSAREMLADLEAWSPRPRRKNVPESQSTKAVIGAASSLDEEQAQALIDQAFEMAVHPEKLNEACDLMEQAFNKWPAFRSLYENRLRLWRKGIVT